MCVWEGGGMSPQAPSGPARPQVEFRCREGGGRTSEGRVGDAASSFLQHLSRDEPGGDQQVSRVTQIQTDGRKMVLRFTQAMVLWGSIVSSHEAYSSRLTDH